MTLDRLSLARFLELLQLPHGRRLKVIERNAREAVIKERFEIDGDGGDFYGPFWSDAKLSVVDSNFSLEAATLDRVARNKTRRRLYPQLRIGFEQGWGTLKSSRIASSSVSLVTRISVKFKGSVEEDHLHARNFMAVQEPTGELHITYPYFSKDVGLGIRHAKLGISALKQGLSLARPQTIAILDVLRGALFIDTGSGGTGAEPEELIERYDGVMREWRTQKNIFKRRAS